MLLLLMAFTAAILPVKINVYKGTSELVQLQTINVLRIGQQLSCMALRNKTKKTLILRHNYV